MSVAWNALAAAPNPGLAFQQSFQQGLDRKKAEEKEWTQYLGNLAQWADTPEKWDQAVDYFAQQYPHARQFKGRFELRGALMARAGIAPPEKSAIEKNVAGLRNLGRADLADKYVEREALGDPAAEKLTVIDGVAFNSKGEPVFESPYDRIIAGPNGSFYRVPRIGFGRDERYAQPQGEVVNGGLPPGWKFEDEGDASGNAGGGFRDPLAPL